VPGSACGTPNANEDREELPNLRVSSLQLALKPSPFRFPIDFSVVVADVSYALPRNVTHALDPLSAEQTPSVP
jgi:hypothetical protein